MKYSKVAKEQVIKRMKNNKVSFENLSEELRDDEKVVLSAIKKNSVYLYYASERLKNDKNFLLIVLQKNTEVLKFFPDIYKDDKELVLIAVKTNEYTLKYAYERLQNDKELLELLENGENDVYSQVQQINNKKWYEDRMEVLANIREKELLGKVAESKIISKFYSLTILSIGLLKEKVEII